jgi:enoyl-CoA hydratase/carnithine racemase
VSQHINTQRHGSILEIRLNRPSHRNALTGDMYRALTDSLRRAEHERGISTVLVSGAGAGFCAGNDLRDFIEGPPLDEHAPAVTFLHTLAEMTVPIVAAVHGAVVGVGATMLLHFDYIVADTTTYMDFAFVRLGLVPEAGSSLLLPRTVGHLRAAQILLMAEPISADHASNLGLITEIVYPGGHLERAREVAQRISRRPAAAVRSTKALLRSTETTVRDRIRDELELFRQQLNGPEFAAAAAAVTAPPAQPTPVVGHPPTGTNTPPTQGEQS